MGVRALSEERFTVDENMCSNLFEKKDSSAIRTTPINSMNGFPAVVIMEVPNVGRGKERELAEELRREE